MSSFNFTFPELSTLQLIGISFNFKSVGIDEGLIRGLNINRKET